MWHLTRLDLHTLEHTWPDGAQREQDGGKRTRRELGSLLILGLTRCPRPLPTVQWAEQTLSSWGSEQVISKGAGFEPWPSEPHLAPRPVDPLIFLTTAASPRSFLGFALDSQPPKQQPWAVSTRARSGPIPGFRPGSHGNPSPTPCRVQLHRNGHLPSQDTHCFGS